MAETDTSFYTKAPAGGVGGGAIPSPLQTAGQLVTIQNQLNQNKLFQQQYDANAAMGPILQAAVDPKTGELDYNKAIIGMATDPRTAFRAGDFAKEAILREKTQQEVLAEKLKNTMTMIDYRGKAANGMLQKGDFSNDAFKEVVGTAVANKMMTSSEAAQLITKLPQSMDERKKLMQSFAVQAASAIDGLKMTAGELLQVNLPQGPMIVRASPLNGVTPLAQFEAGASPGERNTLVDTKDESGRTIAVPRQSVAPMYGGSGSDLGKSQAGNSLGVMPPQSEAGTGSASAGGVVKELSPYRTEVIKDMAGYKKTLDQEVNVSKMVVNRVDEMEKAAKEFETGGGTELGLKLANALDAIPVPDKWKDDKRKIIDRLSSGDRGAAQEFLKLAGQGAMEQLRQAQGGVGRPTNYEFTVFEKSNPNLDTDPRAVEKMFNFIRKIGSLNADEQAELSRYSKTSKPIEDFPAYWINKLQEDKRISFEPKTGVIKGTGTKAPASGSTADRAARLKELLGQ